MQSQSSLHYVHNSNSNPYYPKFGSSLKMDCFHFFMEKFYFFFNKNKVIALLWFFSAFLYLKHCLSIKYTTSKQSSRRTNQFAPCSGFVGFGDFFYSVCTRPQQGKKAQPPECSLWIEANQPLSLGNKHIGACLVEVADYVDEWILAKLIELHPFLWWSACTGFFLLFKRTLAKIYYFQGFLWLSKLLELIYWIHRK